MALGISLEGARELLNKDTESHGTLPEDLVSVLCDNGVPAVASAEWPSLEVPAILTVPSLNHLGLLHYILWDGTQFLDPSNEELRYPEHSPLHNNVQLQPQWSTAILMWLPPQKEEEPC